MNQLTLGDVVKLAVQCGATERATETCLDCHAMLKFARALDGNRSAWSRFHHVMHKHGLHPGRTDDDLIDILDAALAAASAPGVPAGWKLVPIEATPEMVYAYLKANDAYWRESDECPTRPGAWRTGTPQEATAAGYHAMLTALPTRYEFTPGELVRMNEGWRHAQRNTKTDQGSI